MWKVLRMARAPREVQGEMGQGGHWRPGALAGWAAELVRASSRRAKVAGSTNGQGTYQNHTLNA